MTTAYLNGEFLPLSEARVSVMDRGFLFGDGVYEVFPVYNSKPFRAEQHLHRLAHSLEAINLALKLDIPAWGKILTELVQRNGGGDQSIYLQCTRGSAPTRDHAFPVPTNPTIFAYSVPLQTKSIEELSQGIAAVTVTDIRWHRCDIKAITLLPNVLLRQHAIENGAQEAILISHGFAIEASAMNLFIVKDDIIKTTPLSPHILGGITRDLILELATANQLPLQEVDITLEELIAADEVWVTSSNREIVPVIKLDNMPVGNGKAGPIWHKMIKLYQEFKQQL